MIDTNKFRTVRPSQAQPGELLFRYSGGVDMPRLMMARTLQDPDAPLCLTLNTNASAFQVSIASTMELPWLATANWRLEVDPKSAYSAEGETPMAGDVFMADGETAFVSRFMHAEQYVSIKGELLKQPNWRSFVGFRSWRIVIELGPNVEPMEVCAHSREQRSS